MAQIFVFGASTAYGVGGGKGGWPDLFKAELHEQMYSSKVLPIEKHEIYNLCVPGATIADIEKRFLSELKGYSKPNRSKILVIELGGNDAKASDTPDNFINTPEKFYDSLKALVEMGKPFSKHIILIGLTPVDETKTTPKLNPVSGNKSYMTNARHELFEETTKKLAKDLKLNFVPIFTQANEQNWQSKYLFEDGLHPNDSGHQWLYDHIKPKILELADI